MDSLLYDHVIIIPFVFACVSLCAVSISEDSSFLSGSFSDSIIRVWTLTPKKLCPLKSAAQMQRVPLTAGEHTIITGL